MDNKRKKTTVSLNLYNAVKIMINGNATAKEIACYLEIGEATVYRIKASQDFEEYKQIQRAAYLGATRDKAAKEEQEKLEADRRAGRIEEAVSNVQPVQQPVVQTVTVQATHYMMEELREINKTLTLISNKLAFVVEQLT